jgi:formylglycine-generating enzyme required for sulfatase activity
MDHEFLAIAIIRAHPGRYQDVLDLLRNFYALLASKGYSRDELFHSEKDPECLVNLRYWKNDEARCEAAEDPNVHRYWRALTEIATIEKVYEQLRQMPIESATGV